MRYKATFVAGFAVGFIAGARAGRERYDQIVKYSKQIAGHPAVQKATSTVTAKATELGKTAAAKAPDLAKTAAATVSEQVPKMAATARQKAGDRLPFGGLLRGGLRELGGLGSRGAAGLPHGRVFGRLPAELHQLLVAFTTGPCARHEPRRESRQERYSCPHVVPLS